jgi:hypothetical protein
VFAAGSQQKAERAVADGIFRDEIVPIEVPAKGCKCMVDSDETPRGTTADTLAKLRTAFRRDGGTVTAGNASGINDGAAAIVVMSASKANERGLDTFGTVESHASVGVEPKIMGIGPVPAVRKALARAGLELGDIDLFELNEAFAAQSLAVLRELDIEPERINPNGGRSPSATRSERAVAASSSPSSMRCAAATQVAASLRCASAAAKAKPRSSGTAPTSRERGAPAHACAERRPRPQTTADAMAHTVYHEQHGRTCARVALSNGDLPVECGWSAIVGARRRSARARPRYSPLRCLR